MEKILLVLIIALGIGIAIIGHVYYPISIFKGDNQPTILSQYRAPEEIDFNQQLGDTYEQLRLQQEGISKRLKMILTMVRRSSTKHPTRANTIRALAYFKSSGLEQDFINHLAKDPKSWSIHESVQLIESSRASIDHLGYYLGEPSRRWWTVSDTELPKFLAKMKKHDHFLRLLYGQD